MLPGVRAAEGLREQKKRRAKEALERAALELFDQRSFEGTTIKEIAEAAEMSPRTFFRYFGSKEDVVFSRPDEEFAVLKEILSRQQAKGDVYATLKATMFDFAQHLQSEPPEDIKRRARLLSRSPALRRRGAEVVQTWADDLAADLSGREGTEIQPRHILLALVALQTLAIAGTVWGGDPDRSYPEVLAEMFSVLESSLEAAARP
jgi:AcrR family transcriptional regulator